MGENTNVLRINAIFLDTNKCFIRKQRFSLEHSSFVRKHKHFANERKSCQGNALLQQERANSLKGTQYIYENEKD